MGFWDDITGAAQSVWKGVENVGTDIANVWNEQPQWAKGLEIGGAATLATAGLADAFAPAALAGDAALTGAAAGAPLDLAAVGGLPAVGSTAVGEFGGISGALAGGLDLSTLAPGATSATPLSFAAGTDTAAGAATGTVPGAAPTALGAVSNVPGGAGLGAAGTTPAGAGPIDLASGNSLDQLAVDQSVAQAGGSPVGTLSVPGADPATVGAGDITNAPATAAAGASPAAGGTSLGTLAKFAGPAIGAAGLGYSVLSQNAQQKAAKASVTASQQQIAAQGAAATAAAAPELQQGQLLTNCLTTGTLPAGQQAQLDQATAAAKAQLIANAGARGVSTDPTQNSALAQDLANVDQQALATKGTIEQQLQQAGQAMVTTANQLMATGLNATDMSAQLQEYLINLDQTLAANTGKAIANFASALAGSTGSGIKLQIAA